MGSQRGLPLEATTAVRALMFVLMQMLCDCVQLQALAVAQGLAANTAREPRLSCNINMQ